MQGPVRVKRGIILVVLVTTGQRQSRLAQPWAGCCASLSLLTVTAREREGEKVQPALCKKRGLRGGGGLADIVIRWLRPALAMLACRNTSQRLIRSPEREHHCPGKTAPWQLLSVKAGSKERMLPLSKG